MDFGHFIELASGPVAGALSGVASALLGLKFRIGALEKKSRADDKRLKVLEERLAEANAKSREDYTAHNGRIETVKGAVERLEQQQKDNVSRDSNEDLMKEAALANFIADQQSQWQVMQRTLGQIEGMMGLSSVIERTPPPRPAPRIPPPIPSSPRFPGRVR